MSKAGINEKSRKANDEFDIVLSSRVRLARNLLDVSFPEKWQEEEKTGLEKKLTQVLNTLPGEYHFESIDMAALKADRMKALQEKNLLEPEFHYNKANPVIISGDGSFLARIGDIEHLRISCTREGLALNEIYRELDRLDSELENHLDYACSLEWGYHCSSVVNMGTGLRASIILHLPCLVMSSMMKEITDSLANKDIVIKEFYKDEEGSFGNLYKVSNLLAYGMGEEEIIKRLIEVVNPIIAMERKTRFELLNNNKMELEDRIYRALGILTHCRMITFREAIEHLSYLHLGICGGLIESISLKEIFPLFFLLENPHLKGLISKLDLKAKNEKIYDRIRAKMIRDFLQNEENIGGELCLKD